MRHRRTGARIRIAVALALVASAAALALVSALALAPMASAHAPLGPYAPGAATVVFVFATPFTDFVDYRSRVVYAPQGGKKVERSWLYKWAP